MMCVIYMCMCGMCIMRMVMFILLMGFAVGVRRSRDGSCHARLSAACRPSISSAECAPDPELVLITVIRLTDFGPSSRNETAAIS